MKLLEVYTPEICAYVRYKVLDPSDVEAFVHQHRDASKEDYIRYVLESVVFNLKSEITDKLKTMDKPYARAVLDNIFNGCVMLNPGLDVDTWLRIAASSSSAKGDTYYEVKTAERTRRESSSRPQKKKISKARFLGLEHHLKSRVIGQDEAIGEVVRTLKRSIAGIGDDRKPLGVFLFAGASGVGKTYLAKELHKYLFGDEDEMVRIDCGEYQHKHENQKLIGAPPGYLGHDEGGHLTNAMQNNPQTVVLLDEVEKAHPDLWNTFLRIFDEGIVTDGTGNVTSFRDAIIIMTTNLGNAATVEHLMSAGMGFGKKDILSYNDASRPSRTMVSRNTFDAIRKQFRPEFLNRIDKTVVFNHLVNDDLLKIVDLEMETVDLKLNKRGLSITYDDNVVRAMIAEGVNPVEGARGLARIRREKIEALLADTLLSCGRWPRGTVFSFTWTPETGYDVTVCRPQKVEAKATA